MITPQIKKRLRERLIGWEHTQGNTAFYEFKMSGISPHQLLAFEAGDDRALSNVDIEGAIRLLDHLQTFREIR